MSEEPLTAALEPILRKYRMTRARRESLAVLNAVRLAPSLEVCEALLRGQQVPRSKLDRAWARAYGL